jgi:hypothetical protein
MSVLLLICGVAALFGVPAVSIGGQPIIGVRGFFLALAAAAVPPIVVLGRRTATGK